MAKGIVHETVNANGKLTVDFFVGQLRCI